MKWLVISNGHGEDLIAVNLIKAIKKRHSSSVVTGIPLVGGGHAYRSQSVSVALSNPSFPSGGFIRTLKDLLQDIWAGLLSHSLKQLRCIKQQGMDHDIVLVVGDVFCLIMASFSRKPVYFLPTAKSDTFMPHSLFERWWIRRLALMVFPRDALTTRHFQQAALPAYWCGNPMMDGLVTPEKVIEVDASETVCVLLPGSRHEAYQNALYMMKLCAYMKRSMPHLHYIFSLSSTIDSALLSKESGWKLYHTEPVDYFLSPDGACKIYVSSAFLSSINQADIVIGLAGTANEQALFLGKPVICFQGFGPQSTLQRFYEQQRLMKEGLTVCPKRELGAISATVKQVLRNKQPFVQQLKSQDASKDIIYRIVQSYSSSKKD